VFTNTWEAKLTATGLTIVNCQSGILSNAGVVTLKNVSANNNTGNGITVFGAISGRNVTVNGNGGVGLVAYYDTAAVKMVNLTANGNGFGGLNCQGSRTVVVRSTLTGNSYPSFPGVPTAIDLVSAAKPRLVLTTCDHSWGPAGAWGLCSGD